MTLDFIIKQHKDSSEMVTLVNGEYKLFLYDNKLELNHTKEIPIDVLFGDLWQIKYSQSYNANDVVSCLSSLNPELSSLRRSEWNDYQRNLAKQLLYAIARAFGFKIKIE